VILWLAVSGFRPLTVVLNGTVKMVNEETRPFWGQPISQEIKNHAIEKLLSYGAESSGGRISIQPVIQVKGSYSIDTDICLVWASIASAPTLEEEKSEREETLLQIEEQYKSEIIGRRSYQAHLRGTEPAVYQIAPTYSAWSYWLNPMGYGSMLAGIGLIILLLLFLCDVFNGEMYGSLRDVSLTKPYRRKWIYAKLTATFITGFVVSVFLYAGLLMIYGVLYGFHGWKIGALSSIGLSGYCYGMLYADISCLELAFLKLFFIGMAGAALGMVIAAFSALTKHVMASLGFSLCAFTVMESLLYAEAALLSGPDGQKLITQLDMDLVRAATVTPIRLFLNLEDLTLAIPQLQTSFSPEIIYNCMVDKDMFFVYTSALVGIMLVSVCICLIYEKMM